jgi:hypothetical protein
MANKGYTGSLIQFKDACETRLVIVAEGVQYHKAYIPFLKKKLTQFKVAADDLSGEYINSKQLVRYEVKIVRSKKDFKTALETQDAIVIYDGHSRYGRGACFDPKNRNTGEHWEDGASDNEGIFRMGYPVIPVEHSDIVHHKYHFKPWPVEHGTPANESHDPFTRHPDARRKLFSRSMPDDAKGFVTGSHRSPTDKYLGFVRSEANFLFNAGWEAGNSDPYFLGNTDLKCKTFCHFGCSSRLHFRPILRYGAYKDWSLPKSHTERFAYFTTAPSDLDTIYWLYNLLRCPLPNSSTHWWDTHEWAKRKTNAYLKEVGNSFRIY